MFGKLSHNRWLKLCVGVLGALVVATSINLFVVPHGLYTSGLLGFCQLIRTILVQKLGLTPAFDVAGILYLLLNIPLLLLAWKNLGRAFVVRTLICTVSCSVFLTVIPVPAEPIIEDLLTSCLLGGIVCGFAGGLILTCGCSSGGLDILGLYLSKKGKGFTVGKFSISCNVVLYTLCLVLFDATTAIYSTIYTVFSSLFVDRFHQQSITVQVLIFTKENHPELPQFIMEQLDRGVTCWEGRGGYTGQPLEVLCVCLNKYEIEALRREVLRIDPHAFFIVQEGVQVGGNFEKHLN